MRSFRRFLLDCSERRKELPFRPPIHFLSIHNFTERTRQQIFLAPAKR
jgi:hypothetical protein